LRHAIDPQNWEWGDADVTTIGAKYVANYFNGLDERVPAMTYVDILPVQNASAPLIHCTSTMSDACLNAGDLHFDHSGDYLFVTDVVLHRIRVLRVDPAAALLRDTGSFIPCSSDAPQMFFGPDDRLVYAIPDADAAVHIFGFDPASGSLTSLGAPVPFAVPYALIPAARN
jgi:6-phosphogluconolactonase (cycloisomerase 2 family)